ncbi:STM4015 family protein [Nonomuraea sp. NN258]|nr:STM4015 family protein [Nonomuraea antri]
MADPSTVAWRLTSDDWVEETYEEITEAIDAFVADVDTTVVTTLLIGEWQESYSESSEPIVAKLVEHAARFPALRTLFFGAMSADQCEISWIRQSDLTPLLEAYPKLERLEIRGGTELRLSPVRHEALRVLRIETGGLPGEVARAVAACDLPALDHLELWLGVDSYGGDTTVADLEPILSGARLPALKYLGLQDGEFQDDIAAAVASAPVVARLETLSLSMGVLTDAGAEALLTGQPLTHLRKLDLHHHFLSTAMMGRLRQSLPGVELDLSSQETTDRDWRYVAVSE